MLRSHQQMFSSVFLSRWAQVMLSQGYNSEEVGTLGYPSSDAPSSFLFLVIRPGAPSNVFAPSSDARVCQGAWCGDSDIIFRLLFTEFTVYVTLSVPRDAFSKEM